MRKRRRWLIGNGITRLESFDQKILAMTQTLSYAKSLRVLGQALDGVHIDSFELHQKDAEYIVRTDAAKKLSWDERLLKGIAERLCGRLDDFNQRVWKLKQAMTNSDVGQLDAKGRFKRSTSRKLSSAGNISLPLRVIGDFLDEKRAVTFSIWWLPRSVTVQYEAANGDHEREDFTAANLYDRDVKMYLRRSDR